MKEKKQSPHVTFCMDLELKKEWELYCESLDLNASQLVRMLIRDELKNKVWEKKLK